MNTITTSTLVKDLPLCIRIRNTLRRNGVFTVEEILQKGRLGLYRLPGIGAGSIKEIESMLACAGISLPEETVEKVVPRREKSRAKGSICFYIGMSDIV